MMLPRAIEPAAPDLRGVSVRAAVVCALAAAVLGGIWMGKLAAPGEPVPVAAGTRPAKAGPGVLAVPVTWQRSALSEAGVPGLDPARTVAFALAPGEPSWAIATVAPADHPSLIPRPLRRLLPDPVPRPRRILLGGRAAWLYADPSSGSNHVLAVTVQPSTRGVLAVACVSRAAESGSASGCAAGVDSASIRGATTLAPTASTALALRLPGALDRLDRERIDARAALRKASSPGAQVRLAGSLAADYATTADSIRPVAGAAGAPILAALGRTREAYAALGEAAGEGQDLAFLAARREVAVAERKLVGATHVATRRILPEPAAREEGGPVATATAPADTPSPLLLVAALAALGAAALLARPGEFRKRLRRVATAVGRAPADPVWTCEITWNAGPRGGAFDARAMNGGRHSHVVARSATLEWPPLVPPERRRDLIAAATAIERKLVEAGWSPMGRGTSWYARRFAWRRDGSPESLDERAAG